MSGDKTMKVNVHYGGKMFYKDHKFSYEGGFVKKNIVIDPDYMTWSVFDTFCEDSGLSGLVEQVWYKLPHEDIDSVKPIFEDKSDADIMKMCSEAMGSTCEVDLYIEQGSNKGDDDKGEKGNGEEVIEEGGDDDDDNVEEVIEEGGDDPRFQSFFEEVHNEEVVGLGELREADDGDGNNNETMGDDQDGETVADDSNRETMTADVDDDDEFERQCRDAAHPSLVVDTDDEWEDFNRTEKDKSRRRCEKEKGSYLRLLQTFNSGEEFKDQLLRYVLKTNFDVKLCRWEKTKLTAICTNETCKWKIYCSVEKPKGKWMVKSYVSGHNHLKSGKARMLKQGTIAKLFKDEARRRPEIKWTDIKDEIMMRYNISVSKWICTKARRVALDLVIETQQQQFNRLYDYEAELLRSNPRTTTEIVTISRDDGTKVFGKFYICFDVLRRSWKRCCRPIIGLDGTFLKWELKGEVLAAVGRDADNMIYPIAWAVVRVEDNELWGWFVDKLKADLQLGLGNGFTVISDKQKGLINAVADLLPYAEHMHCARHIFANWKKVYGLKEYEDYFWSVAYSYSLGDYEFNMDALKGFDPVAYEDLLKTQPKSWCRAFFSRHARCEDVSNNLSESFNRTIKEARKLPVISMLQEIRRLAMRRITRRHDKTKKCDTQFPPNIMDIFEQNRKNNKFCSAIKSSENLYEVIEQDGSFEVCLAYRHCACNQWNITGIPCRHAIHVITEYNRDPNYVDQYYLTSMWQDNYGDNIRHVNGERYWPKTGKGPIQMPEKRQRRGRPKKFDRIKEPHESSSIPTKATREGRTMTCSNCKQTGHNIGTCNRAHVVQTGPKRKRGRPRKTADDPWSIQNAPRRRRNALSQFTPTANANATQTPEELYPSSAPLASGSRGRDRGRGRPRGCGRGRETAPPIPRPYGCFISPWSGQVFEQWGPNPEAPPSQAP